MLLTHHFRMVDEATGVLMGAHVRPAGRSGCRSSSREAGVAGDYRSFPTVGALDARHRARPLRRHPRSSGSTLACDRVKIDVHAHYLPDVYREALREPATTSPTACRGSRSGRPRSTSRSMDRLGIATSLLSVSSPGVHLGDGSAAVDLARAVNEAGRRAVVDHPGRFGLLASLPLPDVDAAIAEIAHCCDHLDVDGFVLLTNIGGTYLERRRRSSRSSASSTAAAPGCSLHPTSPACWEHTSLGRPRPMIEFLFDTTRAVVDLVLNGTIAATPTSSSSSRTPAPTLPVVADRVSAFAALLAPDVDVLGDLGRLHFDLAGHAVPRPARRAADADDARPPPLRERLPVHARAGRRRRRRAHRRRRPSALRQHPPPLRRRADADVVPRHEA